MSVSRLFALSCGLVLSLQLPAATAARSLTVTVYVHDDLADMSNEQLNKDFFQHWLDEMRSFSQQSIEVIFQREVEHITDIAYAGMPSAQLPRPSPGNCMNNSATHRFPLWINSCC